MLPPVVVTYLIGIVTIPLARMVVKPLLEGTVKTTVGAVLEVKKLAGEAVAELHEIAAEVNSELSV